MSDVIDSVVNFSDVYHNSIFTDSILLTFSIIFSALEMVGPQKRLVAGVGCQLFFTSGYIMTAGFAYYIRDWRYLQIALTVPSIAFLLYYWFVNI